jgi:hypothetical protein
MAGGILVASGIGSVFSSSATAFLWAHSAQSQPVNHRHITSITGIQLVIGTILRTEHVKCPRRRDFYCRLGVSWCGNWISSYLNIIHHSPHWFVYFFFNWPTGHVSDAVVAHAPIADPDQLPNDRAWHCKLSSARDRWRKLLGKTAC